MIQNRPKKSISSLHLNHNKHTAACQSVRIEPPKEVLLSMSMHSGGAPSRPIVSVGDYVRVGQKIAERGESGFSVPVHATVSGTVSAIEPFRQADGRSVDVIRIESDGKMERDPSITPPSPTTIEEFLDCVTESGIVGLGGAAFPLSGKLSAVRNNQIDTVLINGAECEPYITSDHRIMVESTDLIVKGVDILRKWMNAKHFVIGIEDNKPDAIAKLREAFAGDDSVEVFKLPGIYPQGAKQVLLYQATGLVVKGGQRLASLGVIIINVSSLAKLAQYMETGTPLVDRIVTVDGSAMNEPKNLLAPIGTPIEHLLEQAGGLNCEPGKVLIGGPMLGVAVSSLSEPTQKATNAVLAMTKKEARSFEPTDCIRCGRCVANCPAGLNPSNLARAAALEDQDARYRRLQECSLNQCIECACCAYVCPAHIPLMAIHLDSKRFVKKYRSEHAAEGRK